MKYLALLALLLFAVVIPKVKAETCETLTNASLATGNTVSSSVTTLGVDYTATISGTGTTAPGQAADAFYYTSNSWATYNNATAIGTGIKINGNFPSPVPAYQSSHVYVIDLTGTGVAFTFKFQDGNGSYGNNSGSLSIEVCEAGPTAAFTADPISGIAPLEVTFTNESVGSITSYSWLFGDGDDSSDENPTHTYTTPGTYEVTLTIDGPDGSDSATQTITVSDSGGGGGFIRPLRQQDEYNNWGLYDYNDVLTTFLGGPLEIVENFIAPNTLYRVGAPSTEPLMPVMAVAGGTVKSVEYASDVMCSVWGVITANDCIFTGPPEAEILQMYHFPIDGNVQRVVVESGGNEFHYLVYNANQYVSVDDVIEAGCVLGVTIPTTPIDTGSLNVIANIISNLFAGISNGDLGQGVPDNFGIAFIEFRNPEAFIPVQPLLNSLIEYNNSPEPCNINPAFQDCFVANPEFRRGGEGWTTFGDAIPLDVGIILRPGSYVEQQINLPDESSFEAVIVAMPSYITDPTELGGSPKTREFRARLGESTVDQSLPVSPDYAEYSLSFADPAPDLGTFYTFRISNIGEGDIFIGGGCVSTTTRELNPQMCYFANFNFDDGITSWTPSGGVTGFTGYASMPNSGSVSQSVTLQPDGEDPQTYYLQIEARLLVASGFDPGSGSASFSYQIGSETPVSIGSLTLAYNQSGNPGFPDIPEKLSVEIEIEETTTDTLAIIASFSGNANITAIALDKACLSTESIDDGGPGGPPFQATCGVISQPTGDDFGTWISWHWRNLQRFFKCDLMILLNKMFKLAQDTYRLIGFSVRYFISLTFRAVSWLDDDWLPWLNGQFRNMAVGQVTTIYQGGGGPSIWDVLLALINNIFAPIVGFVGQILGLVIGIVAAVVNLVLGILVAVIGIFLSFMTRVFGLLALGQQVLNNIINAYNSATPTPIPGLPDCTDPQSHPACVGIWVIDNTMFSGTGALIIPLMISFFGIHMALWVVSEFRRMIIDAGRVS